MNKPVPIPAGFYVRPATWDDFEPVLGLAMDRNLANYDEPMISAEYLRETWESPDFDLGSDTWLVTAPNGGVAAYATLQNQARTRFHPVIYVAATYQNAGIDAYLLRLIERRAASMGAAHARLILTARVGECNLAAKRLFERTGYVSNPSFLVMETVLSGPLRPVQWPDGITVRTFVPGQDEQATYRADEEASQDKGYHAPMTFEAWAKRMSLHGKLFDPALWFLAWSGDQVAGVALNFYSEDTHTGWVDHLGVRRRWRRQGLGRALLLHSFDAFYRRGVQRVRLSVDSQSLTNASRLYERAGMRTVQQYHVYSKELRPGAQA